MSGGRESSSASVGSGVMLQNVRPIVAALASSVADAGLRFPCRCVMRPVSFIQAPIDDPFIAKKN